MNYTICSSYYHSPGKEDWANWFARLWYRTNMRNISDPLIIACVAGCKLPQEVFLNHSREVSIIELSGNLGHVHQLIGKQEPAKPHALCGWSGAMLATAMLAYCNETDFICLEQDALAFGPWIEKLYEELGTRKMLFGKSRCMPCAQALFIVRHEFIPSFVRRYLSGEPERTPAWLPENKFVRMMKESPDKIGQFSFGFDRDRPMDLTQPVWYGQKFTPDELRQLSMAGLIGSVEDMPQNVKCFTNDLEGMK